MGDGVLIVGADIGAAGRRCIRIADDAGHARIVEIDEVLHPRGEVVVDASGCAVMPGFTDHHLHLHAMAVAGASVRCGPPHVEDVAALGSALGAATPDGDGWIRGVGYVESVAGELTADRLDALRADAAVRIQHRSGALWMLNSLAVQRCGLAAADHPGVERDAGGRPTGRVWRADDWLRTRLPATAPPSLVGVGERLRSLGIVDITDATPDLDDRALAGILCALDESALSGRVTLLGVPLGKRVQHRRIAVGPYKIVLADSALPGLDELSDIIRAAHDDSRAVAVHCVTRVAFALLLAAWEIAGVRVGDRIEHGGEIPASGCADLARRGISVVTQPGFLADRGDDYLDGTDARDHADLYRCGSLRAAGVPVALSSDAPYGPLDPWSVVAAASARRTRSGRVVGPESERLDTAQALRCYNAPSGNPGGRARRLEVGEPGDLIVVDRSLSQVMASPAGVRTRWVVIDGVVTDVDG